MRVAMVTGSYPPQPCGVGDYTERLVQELRLAGVAVDVVTTEAANRHDVSSVQYALKKWTFGNWWKALRWMRTQSYDVIHIQYPARFYGYRPVLALLSIMAKIEMPGIPIVVTLHEFRITHLLRKLTTVALTAPVSAVVLTADSERTQVEKWMPWLRSRLHVLTMASTIPPVPVNDERRAELRRSYGIADRDVVIVYFGLLHANKGIETLLESFAAVHRRMPGTKLMMLSRFEPMSNPYHARLQSEAAGLNIQEALLWTGYLDNGRVSEHLACVDIGFFPFQDGVTLRRLSFMTGMSHGLAVLTTAGHAGTTEIGLRDSENVLLVRAGAPVEDVAGRLLSLVDDAALRARLSKGAREWSAPFQWSAIIPKTLAIYTGLPRRSTSIRHFDR